MKNKGFKVWNIKEKRMIKTPAEENLFLAGNGNLIDIKNPSEYLMDKFLILFETGLKDKNGKDIHEGDIINLYNWGMSNKSLIGKAEIVWDEQTMKFDFRMLNGEYIKDEYDRFRAGLEIIGNKFENSELLE